MPITQNSKFIDETINFEGFLKDTYGTVEALPGNVRATLTSIVEKLGKAEDGQYNFWDLKKYIADAENTIFEVAKQGGERLSELTILDAALSEAMISIRDMSEALSVSKSDFVHIEREEALGAVVAPSESATKGLLESYQFGDGTRAVIAGAQDLANKVLPEDYQFGNLLLKPLANFLSSQYAHLSGAAQQEAMQKADEKAALEVAEQVALAQEVALERALAKQVVKDALEKASLQAAAEQAALADYDQVVLAEQCACEQRELDESAMRLTMHLMGGCEIEMRTIKVHEGTDYGGE